MGGSISSEKKKIPAMLADCPLSVVMSEPVLEEFSGCFDIMKVGSGEIVKPVNNTSWNETGNFFIVGDGQIDVSVKVPSQNKKTGFVKEILCTKKKGDMLWVPSVESYATNIGEERENMQRDHQEQQHHKKPSISSASASSPSTKGRKVSLFKMLSTKQLKVHGKTEEEAKAKTELPPELQATNGSGPEVNKRSSFANMFTGPRASPKPLGRGNTAKIMKQLDMTTVTAPYGATLLHLDKHKFDAFVKRRKERRSAPSTGPSPTMDAFANSDSVHGGQDLDIDLVRVMMKSNIQDYLKRIPFLKKCPNSRIETLGGMSEFELFKAGSEVCTEGMDGDKVYVIIFGKLTVHTKDGLMSSAATAPSGSAKGRSTMMLTTLNIGDHFGELSVLGDIPRQASVRAKTSCLLVSISRAPFKNLLKVVPTLEETVQSMMKVYMLSRFFRMLYSDKLRNISAEDLEKGTSSSCEIEEVEAGARLIKQNELAHDFYFLYHGEVEVIKHSDQLKNKNTPPEKLATLKSGSYFGEISIMTRTVCRTEIRASARCMLLKVSKEKFEAVWCKLPGFKAEFLIRILGDKCRLENVLSHDIARSFFNKFVENEYAAENLHFYDRIDDYMSKWADRTDEENLADCMEIYEEYLRVGSNQQVNIPAKMLKVVTDLLFPPEKAEEKDAEEVEAEEEEGEDAFDETAMGATQPRFPDLSIFEESHEEVFTLMMKDNFARFKKSEDFKELLASVGAYENIDLSNVPDDVILGEHHSVKVGRRQKSVTADSNSFNPTPLVAQARS